MYLKMIKSPVREHRISRNLFRLISKERSLNEINKVIKHDGCNIFDTDEEEIIEILELDGVMVLSTDKYNGDSIQMCFEIINLNYDDVMKSTVHISDVRLW